MRLNCVLSFNASSVAIPPMCVALIMNTKNNIRLTTVNDAMHNAICLGTPTPVILALGLVIASLTSLFKKTMLFS